MFQPSNLLPFLLITFIFWPSCTLNGVVSDPQTNLVQILCRPSVEFLISNISIFNDNLNATFHDIREQIRDQNKHFATAQHQYSGDSPIRTLFQCRNYLTASDCVTCFDAAVLQIRSCISSVSPGAHVVYDGCFLRYGPNNFFDEAKQRFNFVSCGNQTTEEDNILFTTTVRQVLMNLQITTPKMPSFFAATKMNVSNNNGATIYSIAQCVETVTADGCLDCLKGRYDSMQICLPFSDGKALDAGCFMRYSTTSFFDDSYAIDVTQIRKASNKKGIIIGGVVGGVALVLILVALFAFVRRSRRKVLS